MLVVQDAFHNSDLPAGGVAAIGNFDGLHRGQRAVIEQVRERAAALGAPSVVVTFEPHPMALLRPEAAPARITTPEQKERLFEAAGVDVALFVRFTPELARTRARDFVRDFLHGRLGVREVYVGEKFVFGHNRQGDVELLYAMAAELGFRAQAVEPVAWSGERISSTRIRKAVAEGRVEDAEAMLGRPYAITGTIVRGDRMGKRLGWPTINIAHDGQILPLEGVYACRARLSVFPATFEAVTNIGTRPTVYENYQRVVESHLLDFDSDVYGQRVELAFAKRLREERLFPSVMDLSAQIRRDVETTRDYFAARRQDEQPPAPTAPADS